MTIKKTIKLTANQHLSDVADQLPQTAGIHMVYAKTGTGKTYHMVSAAHKNKGIVIFPVKAIIGQQEVMREENNWTDATFVQIENINKLGTIPNEIHIDEAQICYQGGFRNSVEDLNNLIRTAAAAGSKVYLYTATAREELMPIELDTITTIDKPFDRKMNVVQINSNGDIRQSDKKISKIAGEIFKLDNKKVLMFVNSERQGIAVVKHLNADKQRAIFVSSNCMSKKNSKAYGVYEDIINTSVFDPKAFDIVVATSCLSEGININNDFNIVSCQDESGALFQQQGRARKQATHWIITGEGTDTAWVHQGMVFIKDGVDCVVRPSKQDSDLLKKAKDTCEWDNQEDRAKAELSTHFNKHFCNGSFALQVIKEMGEHGYSIGDTLGFDSTFNDTIERISMKEILKWICGDQNVRSLFESTELDGIRICSAQLTLGIRKMYPHQPAVLINRAVEDLIAWEAKWDEIGIKGDRWEIMRSINELGRSFLINITTKEHLFDKKETMNRLVKDYREVAVSICEQEGGITNDRIAEHVEAFWGALLDNNTDYKWFADDNHRMRTLMFKMLIGMEKAASGKWVFVEEKAGWDVKLTESELKNYKRKKAKIESNEDMTMEKFHMITGLNKKDIASMKAKQMKTIALEMNIKF